MDWFKIPKRICKNIDKTNKNFFWNKNKEGDEVSAAIPAIALDKMCCPKCKGGLSI